MRASGAIHVVGKGKRDMAVLALLSAAALVSCGPKAMPAARLAPPPANAHIYTCDDASALAVEYVTGEARATYHDTTTTLPQVQSASGAHYEKDGVSVWNQGRDVTFAQGGTTRHCTESNPDDRAH